MFSKNRDSMGIWCLWNHVEPFISHEKGQFVLFSQGKEVSHILYLYLHYKDTTSRT